jgi:phage-related baseplate assembly protein
MCEIKTFEQIVAELVDVYKIKKPYYVPNESDEIMPLIETYAYRELMLRNFFNAQMANSFWQTATGEDLDFIAEFFWVRRLVGSKPTAQVTFELNTVLAYAYVIEAGTELLNDDGTVSLVLSDITIPAGSVQGSGVSELQVMTEQSDATVSGVLVPNPYLSKVTQTTGYAGGSDTESDYELRERIKLSYEEQTTAGSISAYKAYALSSDERLDDVAVLSPEPGIVDVVLHSIDGVDTAMLSRVNAALSADTARPLCDTVQVRAAAVSTYDVTAVLTIDPLSDEESTLSAAIDRLNERVSGILIGQSVTTSAIIAALSVEGVDDVTLSSPAATVSVASDGVAVCGNINVTVGA